MKENLLFFGKLLFFCILSPLIFLLFCGGIVGAISLAMYELMIGKED